MVHGIQEATRPKKKEIDEPKWLQLKKLKYLITQWKYFIQKRDFVPSTLNVVNTCICQNLHNNIQLYYTIRSNYLCINTIWHNSVLWLELDIIRTAKLGETPEQAFQTIITKITHKKKYGCVIKQKIYAEIYLLICQKCKYIPFPANNNLLTTREFELGTAKSLLCMVAVAVLAADREEDLPDCHSSTSTLWLSKSTSHSSLEPISSGTWKHLVDPKNMERVHSDPQVESILSSKLCHVLVASNAGSFQCLTRHIFLLPTYQMDTERKLIYTFLLHADIINSDLGIRNTTTETGLGVWLVFNLSITPSGS